MFAQQKVNSSKLVLVIIGIVLSYFIVSERWTGDDGNAWKHIVDSDGKGYYAYLPAIFIYQDLYFDFVKRDEAAIYGNEEAEYPYLLSGQRGNRYFIGTALLMSPFFLLAWLLSYIMGFSINGYNQLFFGSVSIAALFYLMAGLMFIRKFLKIYKIRDVWISAILILTVFGTNAFHYVVYSPSMSHIYSFGVISFFIYLIKRYQSETKLSQMLWMAISLAVIGLIRPVNGIIIFSIPFLLGSYDELKIFISNILRNKKHFITASIVFVIIIFQEPLLLFLTYGDFFRWPYSGESFYFFDGHYWDTLISYRKGLFIYTPLIFAAVVSGLFLIRKSIYTAASFILFFLLLNSIISGWGTWYYGGSFSHRAFLEFYPLFIIPLASWLNDLRRPVAIIPAMIFLTAILIVSIVQTWQYQNGIIHYADMNKEKFWKVFLHTEKRYKIYAYAQAKYSIDEDSIKTRKILFNDFEGSTDWGAINTIVTDEYFSPKHSVKILNPTIYSPGYITNCKIFSDEGISYVRVKLMAKVYDHNSESKLVISFESPDGAIYKYSGNEIGLAIDELNQWQSFTIDMRFPEIKQDDVIKIYAWNNTDSPTFLDDVKIEFYGLK